MPYCIYIYKFNHIKLTTGVNYFHRQDCAEPAHSSLEEFLESLAQQLNERTGILMGFFHGLFAGFLSDFI